MDSRGNNHLLHLHILGSGSKGNCALVEGPQGLVMIDDGISRREVLKRMHELELRAEDIKALVLTHEHSDHIKGLAVWCKNWSGPMFCSYQTQHAKPALEELPFTPIEPGCAIDIAGMHINTFSTSHDVADPMGFRFSYEEDSVGYVTDTGIITEGAEATLPDARILAIESNHDVPMLRCGSYPRFLQDRIISPTGHLSNQQAAEALPALMGPHTQHVIAMHISQENNRPSLAVRALAESVGANLDNELGSSATLTRQNGETVHIRAAGQNRPISVW